jgi:DNA-binding transcriptional MerR regulator
LDKAPDAFRTISEVADDLDIPQHVLRFWETRFVQIKPMKRSGGRRYYRPDDVDLLRGIRRLLYGEGYTIRGVQRILKEHGVKSVQGLVDGSTALPAFGATGEGAIRGQGDAGDDEAVVEIDEAEDEAGEAPLRAPMSRANTVAAAPAIQPAPAATGNTARKLDTAKLQAALQDLIACRELLDAVMKEG